MTTYITLPTRRVDPRSLVYVPCPACQTPVNLGGVPVGSPALCPTCADAQFALAREAA
jgi:hypothetical protein